MSCRVKSFYVVRSALLLCLSLLEIRRAKRDDGHPCTFHLRVRPPVFMCPLPGTNPMEATVLRVRLSNEKDGYNPLYPEAEGQTRLS